MAVPLRWRSDPLHPVEIVGVRGQISGRKISTPMLRGTLLSAANFSRTDGGPVRPIRTGLHQDKHAVPYPARRPRRSATAAARLPFIGGRRRRAFHGPGLLFASPPPEVRMNREPCIVRTARHIPWIQMQDKKAPLTITGVPSRLSEAVLRQRPRWARLLFLPRKATSSLLPIWI